MSTILDALKKSERERTLVRGTGFGDAGRRLSPDPRWQWWLVASAVAVVIASGIAAYLLWLHPPVTAAIEAEPSKAVSTPIPDDAVPKSVQSSVSKPIAPLPALEQAAVAALPPPAPALLPADGEAKLLSAMPPEYQQAVPPMTVNIHVYAPDESQRILYINNRQYYRGDEIPGGVMVEEIAPDGVVLQFQGQRFRLPRPS